MVMYVLVFAAGYLLRHFDILRFHVPTNPLFSAIASHQQAQAQQANADLLAKIQGAAATAPTSSSSSS